MVATVSPLRVLERLIFQGNTWHDILPRRLTELFAICRSHFAREPFDRFVLDFLPGMILFFSVSDPGPSLRGELNVCSGIIIYCDDYSIL